MSLLRNIILGVGVLTSGWGVASLQIDKLTSRSVSSQSWKFVFSNRHYLHLTLDIRFTAAGSTTTTAFCNYLNRCVMNGITKELERDMMKLRISLKNVDWTTRVEQTWELMKECIDENEKCLDAFEKKWEAFLLNRIRELDEWRSRHYN